MAIELLPHEGENMEVMDQMDRTAVGTLVNYLSYHFHILVPEVTWGIRMAHRAYYLPSKQRIQIAKMGHIEAWIVAHEFSHHLHHHEGGEIRHNYHGYEFAEVLMRVIKAVGWEANDYPWNREYTPLRKFASKHNLFA